MSLLLTYVLLSIFALYHMHFRHYSLCILISKYHTKSLFNAHQNLFWPRSSMELSPEFHGTFWQHLNNTCGSIEFHGTLATKPQVPWNSMEFCPDPKCRGIFWIFSLPANTMEFQGIPWNLINLFFYKKYISEYCCWYLIDDYMLFGSNRTETQHIALIVI